MTNNNLSTGADKDASVVACLGYVCNGVTLIKKPETISDPVPDMGEFDHCDHIHAPCVNKC